MDFSKCIDTILNWTQEWQPVCKPKDLISGGGRQQSRPHSCADLFLTCRFLLDPSDVEAVHFVVRVADEQLWLPLVQAHRNDSFCKHTTTYCVKLVIMYIKLTQQFFLKVFDQTKKCDNVHVPIHTDRQSRTHTQYSDQPALQKHNSKTSKHHNDTNSTSVQEQHRNI